MKSSNRIVHAFIVRIWIEHRDVRDADAIWRGVIEQVDIDDPEDEELVYFDHLEKMNTFFARYLKKIGLTDSKPGK